MKTPDHVAEMLRLRACGWGLKRIARQLGCSHHTVRDYVATGGVKPFKSPERPKLLDGLEGWLRERFIRHRGNAFGPARPMVGEPMPPVIPAHASMRLLGRWQRLLLVLLDQQTTRFF
jgi:Homeodomain-like domain